MSTFWAGFGSALSLSGREEEELRFEYNGKDLSKITPSDALSEDWNFVGNCLAFAVSESDDDTERE